MGTDQGRITHGDGVRRRSIFRSLDDYERYMQDSVGIEDGPEYTHPPLEEPADPSHLDEPEPPGTD